MTPRDPGAGVDVRKALPGSPTREDGCGDDARPRSTGRIVWAAERVLLLGGLVLLVSLVYELGPAALFANVRLVGWGFAPIVLQESFSYFVNTLGWRAAFGRPRPSIPFRRLIAARIAGDAVNYVTPTATLGGEFVRTRYLSGQASNTALVASVAVAKLAQTIGQIVFIIVGLIIIVDETPLPAALRQGLLIGLGAFVTLAVLLVLGQRRGMFAPLWRTAQRVGLPGAPEFTRRLQRLDEEIAHFHSNANGDFILSVACFTAGWFWGVVEVYLILSFLDVPVNLHRALTIEVLSAAINGMLFFVPGKLGTEEGGKVLIFTILGLDPAKGLAMGIIRRMRELSWAGVGLLLLSRQHLTVRSTLEPLVRGSGEISSDL